MKKKRTAGTISWKEAYALNKRALCLWLRECPAPFLSAGLYSAITALGPYLTIYFSARLLDELAGAKGQGRMLRWVVLLLAAEAVVSLLRALSFRGKEAQSSTIYYRGEERLSRKILTMDFAAAEDTDTSDLLGRIQQRENWTGWGMGMVYVFFQSFLEEAFRMLGAGALTVSLFCLPVPREAGFLTFLNNPLCILGLTVITVGIAVLASYLGTLAQMRLLRHDESMKMGNRNYFFCMSLFREEKRALDMRIYRQDVFGTEKVRQTADIDGGFTSSMAKDAKGKMGVLYALSAAVSKSLMWAVYLFVCLKALGGAFGLGSVTQYIGAITAFSGGLSGMLRVLGAMKVNSDTLKMTFAFLDIPNEMYQGSLTVEKRSDRKYEVEFRDVSFKYPHTDCYALKNISLKFRVGERLAVVGQNGSGKTTFIKLLCRLYDPTEGEILLNGINIRKYNYREYLSIFSVVFQDFQLLAMELGKNVAAGDRADRRWGLLVSDRNKRPGRMEGNGRETEEDYDREKAAECLEKAGLSQWLSARPGGLDTILYKDLDEKGVQISGGEAQKIAIARSLYRDAPFMILDEPTAALDPVAEYEIYTRLNEIVGDKTAVYISHRLSSCRFCDEIIVFHEGSIVQRGSHERLLAEGEGKYKELWNAQAQYYVREQKKRRQKGS